MAAKKMGPQAATLPAAATTKPGEDFDRVAAIVLSEMKPLWRAKHSDAANLTPVPSNIRKPMRRMAYELLLVGLLDEVPAKTLARARRALAQDQKDDPERWRFTFVLEEILADNFWSMRSIDPSTAVGSILDELRRRVPNALPSALMDPEPDMIANAVRALPDLLRRISRRSLGGKGEVHRCSPWGAGALLLGHFGVEVPDSKGMAKRGH